VPLHDTAEGFAALTFTDQERQAISRDNALKLLPSLQRK
jgi:predicted TIM-barrel fold metal-dependent hydrolase